MHCTLGGGPFLIPCGARNQGCDVILTSRQRTYTPLACSPPFLHATTSSPTHPPPSLGAIHTSFSPHYPPHSAILPPHYPPTIITPHYPPHSALSTSSLSPRYPPHSALSTSQAPWLTYPPHWLPNPNPKLSATASCQRSCTIEDAHEDARRPPSPRRLLRSRRRRGRAGASSTCSAHVAAVH